MGSIFGSTNSFQVQTNHRLSIRTVIFFLVSLLFCFSMVFMTISRKLNIEKMTMDTLLMAKSARVTDVISRFLYKTQALAALVIQEETGVDSFERVAAAMIDDPAIKNILIAPSGVVSAVYPSEGNEEVVGYNLLGEGPGNKEAIMAKELGQLVLGGPFPLTQGGQGLVGRLPVWVRTSDGQNKFWGLVSITLKFPQVLSAVGLDAVEKQGFAYELWRINPDDGSRQTLAASAKHYGIDTPSIETRINILNTSWYLRILSVRKWYHYPEHWILISIGLCMSLLVAFIVQKNYVLKQVTAKLEYMLHRDPLTLALNRKGLFYELEELIRRKKKFYLYYMDLNYFKQINDTYGHNVGDRVLIEFTMRIQKHLDKACIFSRISGDEFVLVKVDSPDFAVESSLLWENIYREFAEAISRPDGEDIRLSFSRGVAVFPADGQTIDGLISRADKRMYQQKHDKYDIEKRRRSTDLFR